MPNKILLASQVHRHCEKLKKHINDKGKKKDKETGIYASEMEFLTKMSAKYLNMKKGAAWQPKYEEKKDWFKSN